MRVPKRDEVECTHVVRDAITRNHVPGGVVRWAKRKSTRVSVTTKKLIRYPLPCDPVLDVLLALLDLGKVPSEALGEFGVSGSAWGESGVGGKPTGIEARKKLVATV